jgi:hypothetical protein
MLTLSKMEKRQELRFMNIHKSAEDYLEMMLMLKEKHGYIRSIDIADELGVKNRAYLMRRSGSGKTDILPWTRTVTLRLPTKGWK